MTVYVIDASVACRFLLVEDLSEKASLILEDLLKGSIDLQAPQLIVYEVGNTLWKSVEQHLITADQASQKFSYFLALKIGPIEMNEKEHREILQWSLENKATYYDSTYVKASMKINAVLLTADNILYNKASRAISTVHLKDY